MNIGNIKRQSRNLTFNDIGIPLHKCGNASGETTGECFEVDSEVELRVQQCPEKWEHYPSTFSVLGSDGQPFARPGDSGAVVVDDERRVVGIIVGVDERGDLAYGIPIGRILKRLGISL